MSDSSKKEEAPKEEVKEEPPKEEPKAEVKEEPPKEEPKEEPKADDSKSSSSSDSSSSSSSSSSSPGMSKNTKIALICVGSFIVVTFLITVMIGINMKNHMLKVQDETGAARQAALDKVKARDPNSYQSAIAAKAAAELKAKRDAEMAELAKLRAEADAAMARDKVSEEDMKKANMAIVIAPTAKAEKYVLEPQRRLEFYNDTGMRGYNTKPGNDAFMEKFIELTQDGVRFDEFGNQIS